MTTYLADRSHPIYCASRLIIALCLGLILTLVPALGMAQQDNAPTQDINAMFDAIEFDRDPGKREPIPASTIKRVNLGVHWQLVLKVVSEGQPAKDEIIALREHLLSMGVENDPAYMMALIKHIDDLYAEGKIPTNVAADNFKAAHILAPNYPHAHLAHARHLLRHSPAQVGAETKSIIKGWKLTKNWNDTSLPLTYNLSLFALAGAALAAVVFIFMQMIRYFSVLSYDAVRILPKGFSSVQGVLALLAIILVPGLLLQSPLIALCTLLILLSTVQQPRDRIGSIAIFAFLAVLPFAQTTLSPMLTWNVGSSQQLMHAQYNGCDTQCTKLWTLRQQESTQHDLVLDYTSWLLMYRDGQTAQLVEQQEDISNTINSWPAVPKGQALTILGASLIAQNKPEDAIPLLEQAATLTPKSLAPDLNIMRAAQMTGDREQARAALDRANTKDLQVTKEFLSLEIRDVNSKLRVESLPTKIFWNRHKAEYKDTQIRTIEPVWPLVAGPHLDFQTTSLWIGLAGMLIALLTIPLPLTYRCSTPCPSCGLARDPKDSISNANHAYCLSCYESFVMGSTMSYNERVESDAMLQSRRNRQSAARRYLSLLIPGSGHLLTGYGTIGLLMVWFFGTAVLILLKHTGFWRSPADLIFEDWTGITVIAGIITAILYMTSLWILKQGIFPIKPRYYVHTNKAQQDK